MKDRCLNRNSDHYSDYGGRGITVCREWKNDFMTFKTWALSNGYSDNLTIDRINNNGNYEPNNCRWADNDTQSKNKRNNRYITYQGQRKTMAEWAYEFGLAPCTLRKRIIKGWSIEDALCNPIDKKQSHNKWTKEKCK